MIAKASKPQSSLAALPLEQWADLQQKMIESAPIAVYLCNTEGLCIFANANWSKLFGFSMQDAMGEKWKANVHPEDQQKMFSEYEQFRAGKNNFDLEFRFFLHSGAMIWVHGMATRMYDDNNRYMGDLGYALDITHRKRVEKQFERTRSQAIYASKTAEISDLAGSIAHEINNPLAVITGKVYLIERMIKASDFDPPRILEALQKIQNTADRISKIIKNLRALTRQGDGDPFVEVNVHDIANDVIEFSQRNFIRQGIAFECSIPQDLTLECRSVQIAQAMLNLLNNAADAAASTPERWVRLSIHPNKDFLEVRVTDSGLGIPPEQRPLLMQPFFTTKPPGKGTGLGLTISEGIARAHGGSLELDTKSPNTCFVLRLPRKQVKQEKAA